MSLNYDNLSAMTQDVYIPKLVDNIFKTNILTYRMLKKSIPHGGGTEVVQPVEYASMDSSGGSQSMGFYSGADALTTNEKEKFSAAKYDWVQAYATIRITGKEEALNDGSEKVLDMLEAKMKNAERSIRDLYATTLYGSNNAAATGFNGLGHIIQRYAQSGSGSAATKLGGIERATSSGYDWWNAGYAKTFEDSGHASNGAEPSFAQITTSSSVALAAGATTAGMDSAAVGESIYLPNIMRDAVGSLSYGADRPTLIVTTQVLFDAYEATLNPNKRFVNSDIADAGFQTLEYRGIPVVVDHQCPDGEMFFLNENYVQFRHHRKRNFTFTGFKKPENYDAAWGQILWLGALTCSAPRMLGRVKGLAASY
jgi:hypothetical protein